MSENYTYHATPEDFSEYVATQATSMPDIVSQREDMTETDRMLFDGFLLALSTPSVKTWLGRTGLVSFHEPEKYHASEAQERILAFYDNFEAVADAFSEPAMAEPAARPVNMHETAVPALRLHFNEDEISYENSFGRLVPLAPHLTARALESLGVFEPHTATHTPEVHCEMNNGDLLRYIDRNTPTTAQGLSPEHSDLIGPTEKILTWDSPIGFVKRSVERDAEHLSVLVNTFDDLLIDDEGEVSLKFLRDIGKLRSIVMQKMDEPDAEVALSLAIDRDAREVDCRYRITFHDSYTDAIETDIVETKLSAYEVVELARALKIFNDNIKIILP